MQTPLQKYFAQRVKNLFNHLHDFDLNGDEDSMHDFRVEMKKIRALIRFLRKVYPKQKLKRADQLAKSIFRVAGEIREYQLLQEWLQKNNIYIIEKLYFPQKKLTVMIKHFRHRSIDYKNDLNEVIKDVGKFVHITNINLPEQYLIDLQFQLEKLCSKNLQVIDWHEFRKIIKQWMYCINWVSNTDSVVKENTFSFYNKLQETIGLWHDLELIKDRFSVKQIYLSQDLDIQKDFSLAWDKLTSQLKQKEKQVRKLLAKQNT